MKHLSRRRAIELCIELWAWLAKTGKRKEEWPEWDKWDDCYGDRAKNDCWFCHYENQQHLRYDPCCNKEGEICYYCPFSKHFKFDCIRKGSFYRNWCRARTRKTRKKYAKLFLKQIKEIK